MKDLNYLNDFRVPYHGMLGNEKNGRFIIPSKKMYFHIIASNGGEWDHVSITLLDKRGKTIERCPTWEEMCYVKKLFFKDDETVMQLHPKEEDYVNVHEYCLHLWRPQQVEIPTPPTYMVGPKQKKK